MLIWVIRAVFIFVMMGTAAHAAVEFSDSGRAWEPLAYFTGIMFAGLAAVAIDIIYPYKRIRTMSCIYIGLLVGCLLAFLTNLAIEPSIKMISASPEMYIKKMGPIAILTTTFFSYICISTLIQTQNDFRFIIPYVEFQRQVKGNRPLVLDTSVIIDGRIADLSETGLISQQMIIPRVVLQEMQAIADSHDKYRRNRGRRGLDMLNRLQRNPRIEVEIHEDAEQIDRSTDEKLVALAKSLGGVLVTNDANLTKIAKLESVETININEVNNSLRTPIQWGDTINIKLVKEGDNVGQGVGFLEDGTMVIAEMGRNHIGQEVNIVVTSVLQTNTGRMVFGKIEHHPDRSTGAEKVVDKSPDGSPTGAQAGPRTRR